MGVCTVLLSNSLVVLILGSSSVCWVWGVSFSSHPIWGEGFMLVFRTSLSGERRCRCLGKECRCLGKQCRCLGKGYRQAPLSSTLQVTYAYLCGPKPVPNALRADTAVDDSYSRVSRSLFLLESLVLQLLVLRRDLVLVSGLCFFSSILRAVAQGLHSWPILGVLSGWIRHW